MKITNTAIKYRTAIVALTLILVVGGFVSYLTLPKESNPSIEIPNIVVTSLYPGASPDDVESLVTQVIEQEIDGINGIKEIRSTSTEGVSTVIVEFNPDVAMDEAYQKVRDRVDIAKAELPTDVEEPMVNEIDLSEFPIMTVNLSADYSLTRLKKVAEDLQDELESITSVLEVDLIGGLEREVQVNVDLTALKGYNLTFDDVIGTIQGENTNIPGGSIDVDRLNYLVRVNGKFSDPSEVNNLVVKAPGGQPIYVRDVADVEFGFKDRTSFARLRVLKEENADGTMVPVSEAEGQMLQVISLNVKKRSGDNILETAADVQGMLDVFPFPSGTQVTITGDQSENVEAMVADLENNIIAGLIFVVAVLLFFLGVRNAVLVGIAIPLSMFVSFLVFSVMGQTLNFIILFSLIIALGMLVDNAVVIVENIFRFREEGYSRFEAAKLGTAEVGGAVVASTATTVAAFAPMMLWPGIIGEFMSYLPLTLIITLSSSLFVAVVINPVITGMFVQVDADKANKKPMSRGAKIAVAAGVAMLGLILALANWKTLLVLGVAIPLLYFVHTRIMSPFADDFVKSGLPRLIQWYRGFLSWMLERDYSEGRALLRNTWALGAFTAGVVLAILGGVTSSMVGQASGMILLVPGGLLAVAGILGILFHSLESIFLGGRASVRGGLATAALVLVVSGLIVWAKGISAAVLAPMTVVPLVIAFVGAYGWLHRRDGTTSHLVEGVMWVLAGTMVVGGVTGIVGMFVPSLFGAESSSLTPMVGLLAPALFFGALGFLGLTARRRHGAPLFLTDNRARLLTSTLAALFVIVGLFAAAPTGSAFFPDTDPSQIQVALDARQGTTVEASNAIAHEAQSRIDALLDEHPASKANVENILMNVGVGGDAMFGGGASSAESSTITLNLIDYANRPEPSTETLTRLRNQLQGIPGVDTEFTREQMGPPTGAPINIEISGTDFDRIVGISGEIKQMLREASRSGEIPGLVDVTDNLNTGRPEVQVRIDRERAARFGLSTSQIATTVRAAINGIEAGKWRDGEDEYDIMVRLQEDDRSRLESLKNLTILYEGQQIPLVAVADLEVGSGFGSITRLDLERVVTVQGGAAPGYNGPEVLTQVQNYLSEYRQSLPVGYSLEYTGENQEQQESFGFLTTALLIGVGLIFLIMIAQFNSVSAPFIIMVAVGLSMIGVLLGLMLTQTPFSLFTFIGVISLAGIVVNNNIVLIDYIMQLRARGMAKQEAIIEGGATRLRPVLLTAMTTVLGLIPLTFGINVDFVGLLTDLDPNFQFGSENTQFWGPMGTAIIAGLTFGTFLTLVIVPVMYSTFDSLSVQASRAFGTEPEETGLVSSAVATNGGGLASAPDQSGNGTATPVPEPAPAR